MRIDSSFRKLAASIVLVALAGCSAEGGLILTASDFGVEELLDKGEGRPDLVAIGRAGVLRQLTAANIDELYSEYVRFSTELNSGNAPNLSRAEFEEEFAGWTKLKVADYFVVTGYEHVLVTADMVENLDYASLFGVSYGDNGDLLAARTNADGYFVVRKRLCPRGSGYRSCAQNYYSGLFDGRTGQQLGLSDFTPKRSGKRINPATFERAEDPPTSDSRRHD